MINRDGTPIIHPIEIAILAIVAVLWMTVDAWADYVSGFLNFLFGG